MSPKGGASVINGCVHVLGNTKSWEKYLTKYNLNMCDLMNSYSSIYSEYPSHDGITIRPALQTELDELFHRTAKIKGIEKKDSELLDFESSAKIYNTANDYFAQIYRSKRLGIASFI